ncbi:MAG: hypothetical protein GXP32_08660 [Kiritimatiellaeota bacterium]|nr:hypothetical protein [Kiritimatiellota bacterium]
MRTPLLDDISDWNQITPPYKTLPADLGKARDEVNCSCAESDKFIKSGCRPRPWERLQFIRGTENAMTDIMMPEEGAVERSRRFDLRRQALGASFDCECEIHPPRSLGPAPFPIATARCPPSFK